MMINDTPMENRETLSHRVRHLAVKWCGIQRVVNAVVVDYGRGRGVALVGMSAIVGVYTHVKRFTNTGNIFA